MTDPAERLQQLEQELHSLKQEHEAAEQYMRIAADFDNFRKREQGSGRHPSADLLYPWNLPVVTTSSGHDSS